MQKRQTSCRLLLLVILLGACCAQAQVAYVSSWVQVHDALTTTSFSFANSAVAANDAICLTAVVAGSGGTAPSSVTLTAPGWAWTKLGSIATADYNTVGSSQAFCAIAPDTSSVTFTVTFTGATGVVFKAVVADEFSGNNRSGGTATFEAVQTATGGVGAAPTVSVTPISDSDAIWSAASTNSGTLSTDSIGGVTANAGTSDSLGDVTEYLVLSGNGGVSQTATYTSDLSGDWNAVAVAIRPPVPPPVSALPLFWMQHP